MEDKEFLERADIILEELFHAVPNIALQDYENLNLYAIELHHRLKATKGRTAKELNLRYHPETS